jgi:HTH-type transcriptional regulator/antitoxin HipB
MLDPHYIARMVQFHRRAAGISRLALAELAGVGKTVIYDIEHAKATVRLDRLAAVLQTLNISPQWRSPLMARFEEEEARTGGGPVETSDA